MLYHEDVTPTQNGYWVEAKDLREGDIFLGANGELSTLQNRERIEYPNRITVYNFTVDGNHDYYVIAEGEHGETCILVHNAKYSNPPNPNGKKGCDAHRSKIDEIKADIESRGLSARTETKIDTPNGSKDYRYADVTAHKPGEKAIEEIHQAGRVLKDKVTPVVRERSAIADIEAAQTIKVQFHSYN